MTRGLVLHSVLRSVLAAGLALSLASVLSIPAAGINAASAQTMAQAGPQAGNPFGPPPGQAGGNPFGPPPGQAAGNPFGPPPGQSGPAPAEQCSQFPKLSAEAKKRADAVQSAMKARVDRKQICTLMTNFVAAEGLVVKFLEDNKTWCGVPAQVITISKANHEKSLKFRTAACTEGAPQPKAPTLSDALRTPTVDSSSNVKVGKGGTFDTLTGNPLGR